MNQEEMIADILKGMEYDQSVRHGIWKNNNPDYQDFFMCAHGDMLPDDHKYQMIHDILVNMSDEEDEYDLIDSLIPIYSSDLLNWISSHVGRISYCDDYQDQYDGSALRMSEILMGGYGTELHEVYDLIIGWISEHAEGDEE